MEAKVNGRQAPVAVALWASVSEDVDKRLSENLTTPIKLRPDECGRETFCGSSMRWGIPRPFNICSGNCTGTLERTPREGPNAWSECASGCEKTGFADPSVTRLGSLLRPSTSYGRGSGDYEVGRVI